MRSSVIYECRFYLLPAVSPVRQEDEPAVVDRIALRAQSKFAAPFVDLQTRNINLLGHAANLF
jgi:hypothetical protein